MKKLLIMSILFGTFWIPLMLAAREGRLGPSVKLLQKRYLVFCVIYVITVLYIVPRL